MNTGSRPSAPRGVRFSVCARLRRVAPTLLLALTVLTQTWSGARAAGESISVRLHITNAKTESIVRCQLVLAHFVTLDVVRIEPHHRATIDLQRDIRAGALYYLHEGNQPMALENVLCGLDEDWATTRNDLDLRDLRGGQQDRLVVICAGEQGLSCTPESSSAALSD